MYVLITNQGVYYSRMLTPIARIAKVDRRTIKRWLDNPALALRHGYKVVEAIKAPDYKNN